MMKSFKNSGAFAVTGVFTAFLFAAPAQAQDDLLQEALAKTDRQSEKGWAFTRTVRVNAEDSIVVMVERFDPSKPPGQRRSVLEVYDGDDPDVTAESYEGDVDVDMPLYSELGDYLENGVELVSQNSEEAIYRVLPDDAGKHRFGGVNIDAGDLEESLAGQLTVKKTGPGAPYVSTVSLRLNEEKDGFLYDMEAFDLTYHFAPGPDEKTMLLQDFFLKLDMSFLIFFDLNIEIDSEMTDYEYVGLYEKD